MRSDEYTPMVHGHWEECDWCFPEHGEVTRIRNAAIRCPLCCTAFQKKNMTSKNFCPECGAKMDEKVSEDDLLL